MEEDGTIGYTLCGEKSHYRDDAYSSINHKGYKDGNLHFTLLNGLL